MVLKTQPVAPLETIYEESGSFISSAADIQHQPSNGVHTYSTNETINGLISARSIPSVDVQRQRVIEHQQKPPIEVRYLDGSKHYIHPSTTVTMMRNRRKPFRPSSHNLSLNKNYREILNSNINEKKTQSRLPLNLTIITVNDLIQAGISPTIRSSPDDSEIVTPTQSLSNSSMDTIKTVNNNHEVRTSTVQPIVNNSIQNLHSHFDQVATNLSQSLTPSQAPFSSSNKPSIISTPLPPITNLKRSASPLQVSLTNDENERNLSFKFTRPNMISSPTPTNGTVNRAIQSNTTVSVGGGPRSAFRPFLKPGSFKPYTIPITSRVPFTTNTRPYNPLQQQVIPQPQFYRQPMVSSNLTRFPYQPLNKMNVNLNSNNSVLSKYPYDPIISRKIVPDGAKVRSSHTNGSIQMNISNYQRQRLPVLLSTKKNIDLPSVLNTSANLGYSQLAVDSNIKWHNVTSNSVYDIGRLSTKFPRIPLNITLPVVTPTHNQKLVIKHDIALEKRLLNAGLSPETVALYERILDIAGNRHMAMLSSPQIINQYPFRPFT